MNGRCGKPLVVSNAITRLSISCFIPTIIAIKSRNHRRQSFWPRFLGRDDRLLARFTVHHLAKFGWFVCWPSCAKSGNEVECITYGGWVKLRSHFKPFVEFMIFWDDVGDPLQFQTHCPIMYIMFCSEDIGRQSCCYVAKWSKKCVLDPIFRGRGNPKFWTCIFKSHSLPSKWPVLVEFRSVSSKVSWRKNEEDWRIAVNLSHRSTMSGGLKQKTKKSPHCRSFHNQQLLNLCCCCDTVGFVIQWSLGLHMSVKPILIRLVYTEARNVTCMHGAYRM